MSELWFSVDLMKYYSTWKKYSIVQLRETMTSGDILTTTWWFLAFILSPLLPPGGLKFFHILVVILLGFVSMIFRCMLFIKGQLLLLSLEAHLIKWGFIRSFWLCAWLQQAIIVSSRIEWKLSCFLFQDQILIALHTRLQETGALLLERRMDLLIYASQVDPFLLF
jgi:hypothetical protein